MPLYAYECGKCGNTFERIMTLREMEEGSPPCPECGSEGVKKLMSSGRVIPGADGYAGKIR